MVQAKHTHLFKGKPMTATSAPVVTTPRELGIPVRSINWVRLYPGVLKNGSHLSG